MTNYRQGVAVEYEVKKLFERAGWSVIRGAGSKGQWVDFKPDLIATKETAQCYKEVGIVTSDVVLTQSGRKVSQVLLQCKRRKKGR